MTQIVLDEPILEDDYPMYVGYLYVKDGEVIQNFKDMTVKSFKIKTGAKEVRRCDIYGRIDQKKAQEEIV